MEEVLMISTGYETGGQEPCYSFNRSMDFLVCAKEDLELKGDHRESRSFSSHLISASEGRT